jgi:hypothetical protein
MLSLARGEGLPEGQSETGTLPVFELVYAQKAAYRSVNFQSNSLHKSTGSAGAPVSGRPRTDYKTRFGMLAEEIMARPDLSPACKVVLTAMRMESFGTGGVTASWASLAIKTGMSKRNTGRALQELEAAKLIAKDGLPIRKVQPWRILCEEPSVSLVPSSGSSPTIARPQPAIAIRSPKYPCSECGRGCRNSNTGWCWRCRLKKELKTELRREQSDCGKITA